MIWWKQDATAEELRAAVLSVLDGIPSPGIGTTDLMRRMGCTKAHMDGLAKALKAIRVADPLLTCESAQAGRFGNMLVQWHDPKLVQRSAI